MASVDKIIEKMKHRHFRNDAGDLITIKEESPLKISYITDILSRIRE